MTREQVRQAFIGETVGLFTDSSGLLARHLAQVGDRFELGVARWPILAEDGGVPPSGIAAVMSTKDESRRNAAWAFMKFAAGPRGQELVVRNSAYVPVNSAAVEQSKSLQDFFVQNPLMRVALDTARDAIAWHAFPGPNAGKIDEEIRQHLRTVATLEKTPEEALASLRERVAAMMTN